MIPAGGLMTSALIMGEPCWRQGDGMGAGVGEGVGTLTQAQNFFQEEGMGHRRVPA